MTVVDIRMNQHYEPLGIYAQGYLDAAAALFHRACDSVGLVDYAFYPAAYNLRHGIELFIKQMSIHMAYENGDDRLLYEPGHSLGEAWKRIRGEVAFWDKFGPEEGNLSDDFDIVESVLEEIDRLDPGGTLFRYPEYVKAAKGAKPRILREEPPPFGVVNMRDWASSSDAVLESVRNILYAVAESSEALADQRGDQPFHFHRVVMDKAKPAED